MNRQTMNWRLILIGAGVLLALVLITAGGESTGQALAIVLAVVFVYFLPSIVARDRQVPNVGSVLVINLFLGWTFIGWVVAMAMAARTAPDRTLEPGQTLARAGKGDG